MVSESVKIIFWSIHDIEGKVTKGVNFRIPMYKKEVILEFLCILI